MHQSTDIPPVPAPGELEALRALYGSRWRISWREFADGWRFDATPLDATRPRIVTETAAEADRQIAAAENGTWQP